MSRPKLPFKRLGEPREVEILDTGTGLPPNNDSLKTTVWNLFCCIACFDFARSYNITNNNFKNLINYESVN